MGSPFDLADRAAYAAWRDGKLARHPTRVEDLVVEVADPRALTAAERAALADRVARCNMALYASRLGEDEDKEIVVGLGRQFGLHRLDHNRGADEDAVTSLQINEDAAHATYIPYSNRPIAWHTDGYYNAPDRQIRGLLLHCVRPAREGGANRLMDHEIAYIRLRDRDPALIEALMRPDAMTIPANAVEGTELRGAAVGPVFSVIGGDLHMRYTARKRNIVWRDDPATAAAVAALEEVLGGADPFAFEATLGPGWGLLSNNVLHTRSGFEAGSARLLYRARYYDRIDPSRPGTEAG
ncbi:MAG: TauD/TfdA family dioxygenase [Gammaproteobacteria bacterium]|nr:TauD/TfdA family dioxygenase [Gammaproteobacteria bacterium]